MKLENQQAQDLNPTNQEKGFLSQASVCQYLDISRTTLFRLRKNDKTFPKAYFVTADKPIFKKADLDNWITNRVTLSQEQGVGTLLSK